MGFIAKITGFIAKAAKPREEKRHWITAECPRDGSDESFNDDGFKILDYFFILDYLSADSDTDEIEAARKRRLENRIKFMLEEHGVKFSQEDGDVMGLLERSLEETGDTEGQDRESGKTSRRGHKKKKTRGKTEIYEEEKKWDL